MRSFITDLRSAILFITILPAGRDVAYSPVGMIKCFPLVGMILGGLLLAFDTAASFFWSAPVVAILDVICLVVLTGAFHLDGLGDAADGLFSHRPKEQMLEIMKDSRTGMMGLVAIFCILAMKAAGIYALKTEATPLTAGLFFLVVPAYSRGATIFGIRLLDYGRKKTGTGLDLFEKPIGIKDFAFILIPLAITLFLGGKGLMVNLALVVSTAVILGFYKRVLNCITGDMLGAMTEVTEAVLFLAAGAGLFY